MSDAVQYVQLLPFILQYVGYLNDDAGRQTVVCQDGVLMLKSLSLAPSNAIYIDTHKKCAFPISHHKP